MRACEGCRRRKIKCDAATTNTWPCSACIRLKLHCVPPTVNYDQNFPGAQQGFEQERGEYEGTAGDEEYHQQVAMQQQLAGQQKNIPPIYTQQLPYQESVGVYHPSPYGEPSSSHSQQSMHYGNLQTPVSALSSHHQYQPQSSYNTPTLGQQSHSQSPQSPDTYDQDQYGQQNLADLLGNLRVNADGSGMLLLISVRTYNLILVQLRILTIRINIRTRHWLEKWRSLLSRTQMSTKARCLQL